jgi:hypothetical protein
MTTHGPGFHNRRNTQPPPPPQDGDLLTESGDFLVQEDGGLIILGS